MHIFEIKHTTSENTAKAVLVASNNPFINGKIIGTNDYRSQQAMTVKAEYLLDTGAIKNTLSSGKIYEVTGSRIGGVLHLTAAKEITLDTYFIEDGKYAAHKML